MPWDRAGLRVYARWIAAQASKHALPPFEADAVAALVEQGAREAGRQNRLTARLADLEPVLVEAAEFTRRDGAAAVTSVHVRRALDERAFRSARLEERVHELLADGTLLVRLEGDAVGEVNGLAVVRSGDRAFGQPARISATVAAGDGEVIDIDREVELSGPIHDKGFLILASYLREHYCDTPLSLRASLAFEQSYSAVEGDSASCAELIALLSALADYPVRQAIAVTGSVDQHGRVQAVGGVNQKIEGFFEACRRHGLTGDQGVVIPRANVRDLMLRPELVAAVTEGAFHVWAVQSVDQALPLVVGVPPGRRRSDGSYPPSSVHGRVQARLEEFGEAARRHRNPSPRGGAP
jgi:lon-related putative ATP-dependent protease